MRKGFSRALPVTLSPGQMLRVVRELQGMTQCELAQHCGIPQATISGIERGRIRLGVERTKKFARALNVHPGALLFPDWDAEAPAA